MATSNILQRETELSRSVEWPGGRSAASDLDRVAVKRKRMFDAWVSGLTLVVISPLMLAIAAAIKLDTRGPVLFVSRRWGQGGRVFKCIKFRTMTEGAKTTRVGRLLRRFALDELPQLINVLRGEMSLVGPRPVMAADNAGLPLRHLRRLNALPGMTGLWQIQGWERAAMGGYVSPDECYRKNWSVWLDIEIILRTIPAILEGGVC